ncbi:MAG TPA: HAD-IIIA family hydrolase [Polyangiales bacterium]
MLPPTLRKRPAALLLDAGDTLLFMDEAALVRALAELGEPVAEARISASMFAAKRAYQDVLQKSERHEDGWSVLVRALLVTSGVTPARAELHLPPLRRVHDDFYFWRKVPAELPAALERARQAGIRLGVISNSEGRLEAVLSRVGLRAPFELVVDSQLEGVSKPNPEIFRRALARMNVAPEDALYAGDIPEVDVQGAARAGMHGVLVDAFDHYADRPELARVRGVAQLVDELLLLPV